MSAVPGTQQVLNTFFEKNKWMNSATQSPLNPSVRASDPDRGVSLDFGISSRLAGGCALWFAYLGPASQPRGRRNPRPGRAAPSRGTSLPRRVRAVRCSGRNRA